MLLLMMHLMLVSNTIIFNGRDTKKNSAFLGLPFLLMTITVSRKIIQFVN